jgi:transcription antitermination protein NusB
VSFSEDSLGQEKFNITALSRREIRSLIFHILYAAEAHEYEMSTQAVVDNLNRGFNIFIPLDSEVVTTADQIIAHRTDLDERYKPLLSNWRLERIGVSTKLILRYALWEILYTEILATIIINEAIELAKCFAEKDSYKFINGILDEMIKQMPDRVERIDEKDQEKITVSEED